MSAPAFAEASSLKAQPPRPACGCPVAGTGNADPAPYSSLSPRLAPHLTTYGLPRPSPDVLSPLWLAPSRFLPIRTAPKLATKACQLFVLKASGIHPLSPPPHPCQPSGWRCSHLLPGTLPRACSAQWQPGDIFQDSSVCKVQTLPWNIQAPFSSSVTPCLPMALTLMSVMCIVPLRLQVCLPVCGRHPQKQS